jgi:hypothetical protein
VDTLADLQGLVTQAQRTVPPVTGEGLPAITEAAQTNNATEGKPSAADYAAIKALLDLEIGTDVQAYDADLTSWAAITRASGFDTFTATPSSANLAALLSDESGTGTAAFTTSPTFTTPVLGAATATSISGPTTTDLTLQGGSTGASITLGQGASGVVTANNRLVIPQGTATSPSLTFSGDLNTGFSRSAIGIINMSIHTGGGISTPVSAWTTLTSGGLFLLREDGNPMNYGGAYAVNDATSRLTVLGVRSRGTLAVPTAVQSGDTMVSLGAFGYDGAAFQGGANVSIETDAAISSGNVPAAITLKTGTNSGNRTTRLTVSSGGVVTTSLTTAATSKDAASLVTEGGIGAEKGMAFGNGTTTASARAGGTLYQSTTAVGNITTGVDDLITQAIAANTLATNGDRLRITAMVSLAANANSKQILARYGSTTCYDSTAQTANAGTLWIEVIITRTGGATQNVSARVNSSNTLFVNTANFTTAAETLSGSVTFKLTGEAVSTDDIIQRSLLIEYLPAP